VAKIPPAIKVMGLVYFWSIHLIRENIIPFKWQVTVNSYPYNRSRFIFQVISSMTSITGHTAFLVSLVIAY
jgi:hypothetical protein